MGFWSLKEDSAKRFDGYVLVKILINGFFLFILNYWFFWHKFVLYLSFCLVGEKSWEIWKESFDF
jgi:hypothetical protein